MGGIVLSSNFRSHTRISGNNNGLQKHGVISATGKDSELKKSLQVVISEEQSFTKGNVTIARKADSNYCSRLTGPMHYRVIQKEHITALIDKHSYDVEVTILEETKEELLWWYSNLHPWKITDSSASRFSHFFGCVPRRLGASCLGNKLRTGGPWSFQEKQNHINYLELKAVHLAIMTFTYNKEIKSIHVQMDNIAALAYLVKMGETHNQDMVNLIKKRFRITCCPKSTITAEYLSGVENVLAD